MAGAIDARIDSVKAIGGQSGEARMLVLAALLMADELHDARRGARPRGSGAARLRPPPPKSSSMRWPRAPKALRRDWSVTS